MRKKIKQIGVTMMVAIILLSSRWGALCGLAEPVRSVKIGYLPNYGTIMETGDPEQRGYGFDYFAEIAKYNGWRYQYVPCEWSEGMQMLKNGEIDIFGPMQKTLEREKSFDFFAKEFGYEYGALYTDIDKELCYDDIIRFDGMQVGTIEDNYYDQPMVEYCARNNIDITWVTTDTRDVSGELKRNEYDVFLSGSLYDIPNSKIVAKISAEPFYYAVPKGREDLIISIDRAMSAIQRENAYFSAELHEKYYSNKQLGKPAFTWQEKELLSKYPRMTVGIEEGSYPLQYIDTATQQPAGIAVDILKALGRECGIAFDFISVDANSSSDLFIGLTKTQVSQNMTYTDPYYYVPMVLAGKQVIDTSTHFRLALTDSGEVSNERVRRAYPRAQFVACETTEDAIKAIHNGQAELIFTSIYTFNQMLKENIEQCISYPTDIHHAMSIGVSNAFPSELTAVINKAITRISEAEIEMIAASYVFGRTEEVSFGNLLKENSLFIIAITMIMILIMLALIILIVRTNRSKREAITQIAYVDKITGLPTLLKFQLDVQEILQTAQSGEYMLVALDIDNFKYINEVYGYETGSRALHAIAQIMQNQIAPGIPLSRTNSDNFIIFCKTDRRRPVLNSETNEKQLREAVSDILGESYNLIFSVGIYVVSDVEKDLSLMIDYTNLAKKSGKGVYEHSIVEYTEDMALQHREKREITLAMESALRAEEFVPYIQPQYSLQTQKITGAEVLVRWISPQKGMMAPMTFIPLLEKNGFILKLDLYMFEKTCGMIRDWIDCGLRSIPRMAVNISKITLTSDAFVERVLACTKKYGLETNMFEIELTESVLDEYSDNILAIMSKLKQLGFFVAIDDFGSGYSSLNRLKDIPADVLKIDKMFLSETIDSKKGKTIIASIIRMAKALELRTVAEGVETSEQAESLRLMGCHIAQGYYFARPMPREDFEKLL